MNLQIHFVTGAGNRNGFRRHFIKEAETVNTVTRELHLIRVKPRRFILADLTAHHFVTRAGVARHEDVAHVGAAARVNRVDHVDGVIGAVRHRIRVRCRERVAENRELILDGARDLVH